METGLLKTPVMIGLGDKACGNASPHDEFDRCTRIAGHEGDHMLTYDNGRGCARRWPSSPSPKPVTVTTAATVRTFTLPQANAGMHEADAAVRFLAGLRLDDHPVADQRERDRLVREYSKATGKGGRDS